VDNCAAPKNVLRDLFECAIKIGGEGCRFIEGLKAVWVGRRTGLKVVGVCHAALQLGSG
jgi:hypothetical protein